MLPMANLKVTDVTGSGGQESVTSPIMETMMNAKAMFSVKHLLDTHDEKDVMRHHHQHHQQQQHGQHVDDDAVSHAAEGRTSLQLSSVTYDDPLTLVGTPVGACMVSGGEMSLMTETANPSRHGAYSDMPDVVQASAITASYCDQENLYTRWLQSSAALDCFSGLNNQLMCVLLL